MGNIVKRLKIFVEYLEESIRQIEIEIGVSNGTLSKPFKTGKGITTDTLEKFINRYDELNPIWLIKERGNMILSIEEQSMLSELKEKDNSVHQGFDSFQKEYLKDIIKSSLEDSKKHYIQDLKDTQRLLELEKEVEQLRKELKINKKST